MKYAVVLEEGADSFGAYVPDLPGCVAAAKSRPEVLRLISEAIAFHLQGLAEQGGDVPPPSSTIDGNPLAAASIKT